MSQRTAPSLGIECAQPYLVARLPSPCRTLGWTLLRPGFVETTTVAWLEVRNADLAENVDPCALLREKLESGGLADAVAFMTSRDIRRYRTACAQVEGVAATCVATVGLTNGEAVGARRNEPVFPGTINTLVHVSRPLSDAALIEAVSIVAQARTVAILDTGHLRAGPRITGTGTDCVVVAAPVGANAENWAGLHTAVGEAIGDAVYRAVRAGAEDWSATMPQFAPRP